MRTTTYICDRCKTPTIDSNSLTLIEVSVRKQDWNFNSNRFKQEWCKKCCMELKIQLKIQLKSLECAPKDPFSLERVLREFVLSTIESAKDGN